MHTSDYECKYVCKVYFTYVSKHAMHMANESMLSETHGGHVGID